MKTVLLFFPLVLLLTLPSLSAQSGINNGIKVKGVVSDAKGLPVKGGYVFVDSLKTGYRTNKKGEFKLRVPSETMNISIFSEENGIVSEVYNGQELVNFTFPENSEIFTESELSNMGYIFDEEVFRNIGKKSYADYTDVFQIIKEKFTGVTVDGSSIYVRGYIGFGGSNQTPLFIVDGNYVDNIAFVNPSELKSIELLKGDDTAFYGSRGAAGVFLITLKK